jgi:hypothetical protein
MLAKMCPHAISYDKITPLVEIIFNPHNSFQKDKLVGLACTCKREFFHIGTYYKEVLSNTFLIKKFEYPLAQ